MKIRTGLVALIALTPLLSDAQGVIRPRQREQLVMTRAVAAALAAGSYQGTILAEPTLVTRVTVRVSVVSGGGAGNTVFRISDGTNNCDCTLACSVTGTGVVPRNVACSGACSFAAGASLALSVDSSTCTTTQPAVLSIDVRGKPL